MTAGAHPPVHVCKQAVAGVVAGNGVTAGDTASVCMGLGRYRGNIRGLTTTCYILYETSLGEAHKDT